MPRERDQNRKMFHKGHYEVIAARFREQVSRYVGDEGAFDSVDDKLMMETGAYDKLLALRDLADGLSARFEFDNEQFDRSIFMERCGFSDVGVQWEGDSFAA